MGMIVQHNMNALNAYNKLNTNVAGLKKSSEKLSSGYRINRAGDDAAGLAISEKMRSQIRGLGQAKRNAQDGVSMIQTFEGAAQETHSILQRMKELATESSNGTYDDPTDRAAIQLEFDQLNDELNQIADTDFNGTIVLNGGVMADGLEAVDGKFDYANKKDQLTEKVTKMLDEEIAKAQQALDTATAAVTGSKYDLSSNGEATQWNTVDNSMYNKGVADDLWKALKLDTVGDGTGDADLSKGESVDVTFEYNGSAWVAKSATAKVGETTTAIDITTNPFTVDTLDATDISGTTGNGGFKVTAGGNQVANAIFDASEAKTGDTVTLTFTNKEKTQLAPNNIGFHQDSVTITSTGATAPTLSASIDNTNANNHIEDDEMTQALYDAFKGLEEVEFTANYDGTATLNGATLGGQALALTTAGAEITIGTQKYWVAADTANAPTKFTVSTSTGTGADQKLFDINISAANATTTGSVSGKLAISAYDYKDPTNTVTVTPGDDPNLEDNNELVAAKDAAQAALTAAQSKKNSILTGGEDQWDKVKEYYGTATGVSIADSADNSTARLTYAENITLQTGARSKDSVNFTFNYNMEGTADMGNLVNNLNLSARKEGLNTENLKLDTQESANQAIDQIDKAINKTSMVRASFGSIQNRLEHKMENLTTTKENLTEAEAGIRDTDMAEEMLNYTKFNVLQQAAQSMLAQANQQPQSILQLLG